jgi:hypothetical protein
MRNKITGARSFLVWFDALRLQIEIPSEFTVLSCGGKGFHVKNFPLVTSNFRSRHIVVGIATGYGLDAEGSEFESQ